MFAPSEGGSDEYGAAVELDHPGAVEERETAVVRGGHEHACRAALTGNVFLFRLDRGVCQTQHCFQLVDFHPVILSPLRAARAGPGGNERDAGIELDDDQVALVRLPACPRVLYAESCLLAYLDDTPGIVHHPGPPFGSYRHAGRWLVLDILAVCHDERGDGGEQFFPGHPRGELVDCDLFPRDGHGNAREEQLELDILGQVTIELLFKALFEPYEELDTPRWSVLARYRF